MVAINTTPEQEAIRKENLIRWLKRTQEVLAHQSLQGQTFHRLFNLLRTKRLVEVALTNVLANVGARSAGVDGVTSQDLKADEPRQRLIHELWQELCAKTYRPSPVRRVYIPKPNGDQRPLGIPTIKDRTVQEMLRLILEPIYEAQFYGHSYGFRPFRSTHHAALRIKDLIGARGYTVAIEGDIRKCFDRIHHAKLLSILRKTIKDERIIKLVKALLKAGVMEDGAWQSTDEGAPQGGIVSPLLANIYLNELDQFVRKKWDLLARKDKQRHRAQHTALPCYIVRYADDFVVMVRGTEEQAGQLRDEIAAFLRDELHLELSADKTLITPVEKGFDFLGFHIRKYQQGVTLITPSKKAVARFKANVRNKAWKGFSDSDVAGIILLNRYIIGWGMYYRHVSSTRVYNTLDHYIWMRVWRTTRRLRSGRKHLSPAQHRKNHFIRYRQDINAKNRWRQGGHYGAWADHAHANAYIIARLAFIPIKYMQLHPQLNPYIPEERTRLESKRGLQEALAKIEENEPKVNRGYGPEWAVARQKTLTDANRCCMRCGRPISGHQAQVHHKVPLKQAKSRRQANLLENLIAYCAKCHALAEREGQATKQWA